MAFSVLGGCLLLETAGERPSEDPLWLVWFARRCGASGRFVDAGCGLGIAGLAFLLCSEHSVGLGVDVVSARVDEALVNARVNGLIERYSAVCMEVEGFVPSSPMDFVLCNPPFYPLEAGHGQGDGRAPETVLAKVADEGLLARWVECFLSWLVPGGRVFMVLHAAWGPELERLAGALGVRVVIVPLVTHPIRPPKRVLVEIVKGEEGVVWGAPVAAYEEDLREEVLGFKAKE